MKIYRTTYLLKDSDSKGTVFHSSASDASKTRTGLKAQNPGCKPVTAPEELLQTKEGILQYLNGLFAEPAAAELEQK